ncbi:hypothetical protein L3Q82_013745, partial [Scortum barcoo]
DLAKQHEHSSSTICTILKQKELIKAITPAKGIKIISKQWTSIHENMEKLVMVWLTEKQLAGDTVMEAIICEKAQAIYEALGKPFKASRGWFENFKKRTGIHSIRHGEAWTLLEEDAKALYLTAEEKSMPGYVEGKPEGMGHQKFFVAWVNLVFGPVDKKYLQEKNLPLQALLVLDNAPAYPPNLEDDILEEFKFIKVLYLPPNTAPILQPMDQQVISNFKKLFTHLYRSHLSPVISLEPSATPEDIILIQEEAGQNGKAGSHECDGMMDKGVLKPVGPTLGKEQSNAPFPLVPALGSRLTFGLYMLLSITLLVPVP